MLLDNKFKERQRIKASTNKVSTSFEIGSASHTFAAMAFAIAAPILGDAVYIGAD